MIQSALAPFLNNLVLPKFLFNTRMLAIESKEENGRCHLLSSTTIQPPAARDETVGQALLAKTSAAYEPSPEVGLLVAVLFSLVSTQG